MSKRCVGDKAASSRLHRWVDPSFTDFSEESFLSGKRKDGQALCSKAEPKKPRKRKGDNDSPGCHTSYLLKETSQRYESWVDRYSPRSQADLAVHKKKIEEVEDWIRVCTKSSKGGLLLLTGPSGSGKTATVRVLCRELGVQVQEWTNPTSVELNSSCLNEWRMGDLSFSSQVTQFQDFLLRANKYNCLQMVGDGGSAERKIILVEDFPNQFYRQPGSLHDILRHFVKSSRCPLVFILSDSPSGNSSCRFLFPRDVQDELNISTISFNPVAPTSVMKVLTRILALETAKGCGRTHTSDQAVLDMLCSGSSGDIRSAINSLQFSSFPDTSVERGPWRMKDRPVTSSGKAVSRTSQKKRKAKQAKEQEVDQAIGGKDASLFLFRALGKILHCKRGTQEDSKEAACDPEPVLPSHLSHHQRESLLVNPEWVVERSHMSGEFFNLYLHQNYLDFFSEVDDVVRASEYLSDADLLTADWTSRSIMEDYKSSVATRGLLHSNSRQVSVGFRPLHKPNWLLVYKNYQENSSAAQSLFRSFCLPPVSLQTELLPYLAKLTNPMRNQAQITFIQDVGQMSLRRLPGRLKLEPLADKESGLLEINTEAEKEKVDKEGGQGAPEEALPASQPQPAPSQEEEDDEDLVIEEYASD
ncbi:uncharacterized protein V6R79_020092 [Siganus canaliculatus]